MGVLDVLLAGPRVEEIKMAYVGKYIYDRITDKDLKLKIFLHANSLSREIFNGSNIFDSVFFGGKDIRTQYILIALAMMEMGIDPRIYGIPTDGIHGFQYRSVKRPGYVGLYDDSLWQIAIDSLKKWCNIDVEFIPRTQKGIDVVRPDDI